MAKLIVNAGPDLDRSFELEADRIVVGRHSENAIALTDPRVSRRHVELRRGTHGGFQLFDLQSGNGTTVNGRLIQVIDLRHGDRILIGDTELVFHNRTTAFDMKSTGEFAAGEATRLIVQDRAGDSEFVRLYKADDASLIVRRSDAAILAAMLEVSEAVARIADVEELLGRVLELMLRNIPADHACALLRDEETGTLMPRALRARTQAAEEFVVSRTIIDHVMTTNEPIRIGDAESDERFTSTSVAKHHLRDVLCVPLRGRRETVGVVFLDTVGRSRLTEAHLPPAVAMAYQAAIAVEETRHYEARLQAERLAVVGRTIADLSHHIKNIMQGVRFGSDMVRLGLNGDDEMLRKGWSLVERNQARIDDLILDMLSFSKQREPSLEETDLTTLVNDALDSIRGRAAGAGIAIVWEPKERQKVKCDPAGLHRALLNVLGNALDALEQTEGIASPSIRVTADLKQDFAEIRIADNGPGIPEAKRESLFQPFVSTKGSRGTGLGLPAGRKTLREHGGDLTAAAAELGGAAFTLRWPT